MASLRFCWAVLEAPTGKRLAPVMGELMATLRRFGELDVSDELAGALAAMSPATMDRRLAPDRAAMTLRGRSHTKPGSLLKDAIAIRTWAQWDDAAPGFVEIDLVGHEGGNASGEHAYTLTVTDIATGWTEYRSVPNKARKWVIAALMHVGRVFPFPIIDIDCDKGSEFINHHLFDYCTANKTTFTRSRASHSNDGAHVEQKNWTHVRKLVGYHRYDTPAELALLNQIWELDRVFTNYLLAGHKLVFKHRNEAKETKRYDTATTPHLRAIAREDMRKMPIIRMNAEFKRVHPAAQPRQTLAITDRLETLSLAKKPATVKPVVNQAVNR